MDVTELIKSIEEQMLYIETGLPDYKSWQAEIGVILTENEAKFVLELLKNEAKFISELLKSK